MAKKIEVGPEVRAQIMEEFGLKFDATFYNAMRYESDSPSARMIRRRALELGGREWFTRDEFEEGGEQ